MLTITLLAICLCLIAMAVPTPTARVTPTVAPMEDGYQTLITFAADPDIALWERTVTTPGVDGGEAIDINTMHTEEWRGMALRQLKSLTESSMTVGWAPEQWSAIVALINVDTTVTVHYPSGHRLAFFGGLRSFEPSEHSEGSMPEAVCNITPTNRDPSTGDEEGPVMYSPGAGTGTV